VGDIGLVAGQQAGVDAAPDVPGDEQPDRAGGRRVVRPRIEVAERARVHHLRQHRILADEGPEQPEKADQVGSRVVGIIELAELEPQLAESLEEDPADEPGLVAEQLVDGGDGRRRPQRDLAGGEPAESLVGQHRHRGLKHPIAQFRRALLCPRHDGDYTGTLFRYLL
jgi:hypothetical protein